jgi:thioredoxin reductase/SAM-dependent methyltransferase
MEDTYDVVVIGGGPAGLSGALALARARRSVLVIDGGSPRNAPAGHVHNYLGREGSPPADLLAAGRAEVTSYGGIVIDGWVKDLSIDRGFQVRLTDERTVTARRLLLATGLADELPDVPGVRQRWGRDVLHCPYCHGFEIRDQRIGVLATRPAAVDQALLWRQWSPHVMLLSHEQPAPDPATAELLAARAIPVVAGPVERLEVTDNTLSGVRLADGDVVELDAVVVAARMVARADLLAPLGLKPVDFELAGHVVGTRIPADPTGKTAVAGAWVAGNVRDLPAHVISSAADGLAAGAAINNDLIAEETAEAVAAYRIQRETMFSEAAWEERYRSKPAIWSGNPNPHLIAQVGATRPGQALDVGCGEGADAVWLAQHGWYVTAVDISRTAIERATDHASSAGVASSIDFRHADLGEQAPEPAAYDLVTSQFMHLPPDERRALFAALAASVAPSGTLLIVGHHPTDLRTSAHRMHFPDMMFSAEEVAESLDPSDWDIEFAGTRARAATDPEGRDITIRDAVLIARRR